MSLMRHAFQPTLARTFMAVALVCALFVAQLALAHHTIEHTANANMVLTAADTHAQPSQPASPERNHCLTCLEDQAHGAALISQSSILYIDRVHVLEHQALAPNAPYLAPERASQRAPPVLS